MKPLDLERRFCFAGVEVLLCRASAGGPDLAGFYGVYASEGRAPDLVLEVEVVPGLAEGRARSPNFPAFVRRRVDLHTIELSRSDAEGSIALPEDGGPIRAIFRVSEHTNSLEATIRATTSLAVARLGGLILHASAVAVRGEAQVFAGASGVGKSTVASMLARFPGVERLADELLVVRPDTSGIFRVQTPPFAGDPDLPAGASRPLGALNFLAKAPAHNRTPLDPADGLRELLRHILIYVAEPATADQVLATAAALASRVPCYRLEFRRDPGVSKVLGIT